MSHCVDVFAWENNIQGLFGIKMVIILTKIPVEIWPLYVIGCGLSGGGLGSCDRLTRQTACLLAMEVFPMKWAALPLKSQGGKGSKGIRAIRVLASLDPADADGDDNDDEDWDLCDPDLANDEIGVPDEFDEEEPDPDDRDFWQEPDELED
jgi:hypothetical protein